MNFLDTLKVVVSNLWRSKLRYVFLTETGFIGMPLNSLLENDRKRGVRYRVPLIFKKMIDILRATGLKTEGLFRVPGSAIRLKVS